MKPPKTPAPPLTSVGPPPALPFREVLENEFDRLRRRLLLDALWDDPGADGGAPLRQAANEAASAARASGYPLLTFPVLFEELVRRTRDLAARRAGSPHPNQRLLESVV